MTAGIEYAGRIEFLFQTLVYLRKRRRERMKDVVAIMMAKRRRVSAHRLNLCANLGGG